MAVPWLIYCNSISLNCHLGFFCCYFSLLRDSCMLIHWIAQLTQFFACFLSPSFSCGKCCCRLVLSALDLLDPEPTPNGAFSECCCSIAGNHVLQLQEQHIHNNNKLPTNLTNKEIIEVLVICVETQCNVMLAKIHHIYYLMLISR